jgi:hypothetical protein
MPMAATALGAKDGAARQAFGAFFTARHRGFGRLAYLLSGDQDAAEDIVAEAFAEAWRCWEQVTQADSPVAIAAGASLTIGYTATFSGADTPPTWYSLNGVRCG